MEQRGKVLSVLIASTLAFTVRFHGVDDVWRDRYSDQKALNLNATEFGLLTATPVLTSSLIRVPLGIWTGQVRRPYRHDHPDGLHVPAIWLMAYATGVLALLVIGLLSASRAGPSRLARPTLPAGFRRSSRGFAMGVYGAGNSGAAVNFIMPAIVADVRLDDGPAGLCRHHAWHRDHLLVVQPQRSVASRCRRTHQFTEQLRRR